MGDRERDEVQGAGGPRADFPAKSAASFRDRVLDVVRCIPRGYVTNYGTVALLAGRPSAARQVGGVLYGLRESEHDVPWHRVVNVSGGISTFKVGTGELQVALLKAEGVTFVGERVNLKRHGWRPEVSGDATSGEL